MSYDTNTQALMHALRLAIRQNELDMLMTGEELRACRATLAAAEAQPVALPMVLDVRCDFCGGSGLDCRDSNYECAPCNGRGFIERKFAAPAPALVPLTDEQIDAIADDRHAETEDDEADEDMRVFGRSDLRAIVRAAMEAAGAQPTQVPLTEEQIALAFGWKPGHGPLDSEVRVTRIVERAHGIGGKP